jgi:DNA-binding MarR family transcriptional regulator
MKDKPLTPLQQKILAELKQNPRTCTDLASKLKTSRLAIASAVRRLEDKGQVKESFIPGYPHPRIEYAIKTDS